MTIDRKAAPVSVARDAVTIYCRVRSLQRARVVAMEFFKRRFGLFMLLLLLVTAVAFVNPLREIMTADDGWAYSLSVRHLLNTGEYRLHDWAGVNMPVQIYWSAFFAKLFGYSFILLRLSTLVLLLVGVVSFYYLLQDFGAADVEAALISAAVVFSPIVFFLSFTFHTDVQFLGWELLALWLYTRALRKESYGIMALASVAGAAAIGTRQFGVALIAGFFITWLFLEPRRFKKSPLYALGLALPLFMAIWQIRFGTERPSFSQKITLNAQWVYLRDWLGLVRGIFWRPSAILQYLAFFLLPLLPFSLALAWKQWSNVNDAKLYRQQWWLLATCTFYITAGLCYRSVLDDHGILMPYLAWILRYPGRLGLLLPSSGKFWLPITVVTYGFAITLTWLLARRYFLDLRTRRISKPEWFVMLCGFAAVGLQLIFVQLHDVYIVAFVPFVAFALSQMSARWPHSSRLLTSIFCLFAVVGYSLLTRANLSNAEANWKAAQIARAAGADPHDIAGNMTWSCYNGAFDEWVSEMGWPPAVPVYEGGNLLHPGFFRFLQQRYDRAHYLISASRPESGWQILATVEYRDISLRSRPIYVCKSVR